MKTIPFDYSQARSWAEAIPTPFYIYDEEGISNTIRGLQDAFSWNDGYRELFAVKATPTPAVLRLIRSLGCGMDCASIPEIVLAKTAGATDIIMSSNETTHDEYRAAYEAGAIINLDDLTQVDILEEALGKAPETICVRYNPGEFGSTNEIMGHLYDSKFGMPKDQLMETLRIMAERGTERFGIHAMFASSSLSNDYYPALAKELFELTLEIRETLGITLSFVNLSGGIGIPYEPGDEAVDIKAIGEGVREHYEDILRANGIELDIYTELGRYITGPHGYLITSVIGKKHIFKEYIGVDATASCLMRPAIYGSYHHIEALGKEDCEAVGVFDVVGSLCENNDKFAVDRELPALEIGDLLAICDAGAHGHSMGYTYNGKLRPAEYMMAADGSIKQIRRAQSMADYFATLDIDPEFTEALAGRI